jgi:hypothetical protein
VVDVGVATGIRDVVILAEGLIMFFLTVAGLCLESDEELSNTLYICL